MVRVTMELPLAALVALHREGACGVCKGWVCGRGGGAVCGAPGAVGEPARVKRGQAIATLTEPESEPEPEPEREPEPEPEP